MATATVNLGINLSAFTKGIKDAGALVTNAFTAPVKGVHGLFGGIGKAAGSALATIKAMAPAALAITGALALVKLAWEGIQATVKFVFDSISMADDTGKSLLNLENAAKGMGQAFSSIRFENFVKDIAATSGAAVKELNTISADLFGRGFTEKATKEILAMSVGAAQLTGDSVEGVAKKMADALSGSVDAGKKLGIEIAKTGSATRDAELMAAALQERFGGVAQSLQDPGDGLKGIFAEVQLSLGENILPLMDELVVNVTNFIAGLNSDGQLVNWLTYITTLVFDLGKAIWHVFEVAGKVMSGFFESFKLIGTVILSALDIAKTTFTSFIPGFAKYVLGLILDTLQSTPGLGTLLGWLGIEEGLGAKLKASGQEGMAALSESMGTAQDAISTQTGSLVDAQASLIQGVSSGSVDDSFADEIISSGAKKTEERQARLMAKEKVGSGELVSETFREEEDRKAKELAAEAADKAAKKAKQEYQEQMRERKAREDRINKKNNADVDVRDRSFNSRDGFSAKFISNRRDVFARMKTGARR